MPITNLSQVTFTPAEITDMNDTIATQNGVITPKATNLTEKERQAYSTIDEKNKLMIQKVLEYSGTNPDIVPPHCDKDELDRDYASRNLLEVWEDKVKLLLTNIQNTRILLDYDVDYSCRSIYRNVRYMAGENIPGMKALYNDLKQFFPGGGPAASEAPAPPQG